MSAPGTGGVGAGTCLLAGTVMLAVPAGRALVVLGGSREVEPVISLIVLGALAVGLVAVAIASVRPGEAAFGALALLGAALGLLAMPPSALAAAGCGLAAQGFVVALRLHRLSQLGPLDIGRWLTDRRPMLIGAMITTPGAVGASVLPSGWSLFAAGLGGVIIAVLCAWAFAPLAAADGTD